MNELLEKYGKCPSHKESGSGTYTYFNAQGEDMVIRKPIVSFHHDDGTICMFDIKHRAHIIPKDFTSFTVELD